MRWFSARLGGAATTGVGLALAAVHVYGAYGLRNDPIPFALELVPIVSSAGVAAAGVAIALGRVVPRGFVARALAWMAAGTVVILALSGWMLAGTVVRGYTIQRPLIVFLNVVPFGVLAGLLVGVYDAHRLDQQRSVAQLNRINETLRVATREMVQASDRDELEQAVCDRLTDSEPYDAVWVGRYDADAERVRPTAWAGFDDDYFRSITVTVDDTPTGRGAGGRAIKTRELQCVHDVFDDPTMKPWWPHFERHGIESLAVVPITHEDTTYGFYSVYADRQSVFDERERDILAELGESLGHAIASIEAKNRLAHRERELERQNDRLAKFAAVVSHDLRNPLQVADGYLPLARETGDDEYFDRVADALDRMTTLIEDLLTLARQGEAVSDFEHVDLADVVDDAWQSAGSPDATLNHDSDLGRIPCDPGRLQQLFENLFRNALEHAGDDVTLTVGRLRPEPPQPDNTSTDASSSPDTSPSGEPARAGPSPSGEPARTGFFVADDGPGVPEPERDRVFETGYTTGEDGTGFGLNIVKEIAAAHGWTVSLTESDAGGARFEFAFDDQRTAEPNA
ncbi:receiver/sensor box histidine kinase [Halocalculus aciditolerans]|uniref:histidine kinase n=1 Tax=Halocalculus aciditolerans TaxID=1383812 RepID=A0A830F0P1_9EURY|nr:GAF domain-containing sensor histidine kinase [Halocalculus aciditolerans]GGL51173.1 hypothetical protein GCM10009039_06790 [Halocalculus aciditolerans]